MYTYKLHKPNATPVLSSRTHLGAHKRAAPFRSMFSCKGEEGNIGMLVWGGRGAREGGGGGGGEWGSGADFGVPRQIHWSGRKLHRRTLGLIYGFTQRDPPPPPAGVSLRGGCHWGGD